MAASTRAAVIDASIILALLIPDESLPKSLTLLRNQITANSINLHAPTIIDCEVTNTLHMAVVRQRFDHELAKKYLKLFNQIKLKRVIPHLPQILELTHAYSISAYDASYLELAQRLKLPLYSLDKKLLNLVNPSS